MTQMTDVDTILALANETAPAADMSRDEKIAADVDAILAEIAGVSVAPSPAPIAEVVAAEVQPAIEVAATKPARKPRAPKQDASVEALAPSPSTDAAAGAIAPSPAPAATDAVNAGAFASLLSDTDRAAFTTRLDEAAKKVREKIENAVASVDRGKKLSRFTELAVKELVTKGTVTGKDLVTMFEGQGLAIGTARAQGQQMTAIFRTLGLAAKDGGAYTLANRTLAEKLIGA